jgi:hypothetical protein
MCIYICSSEISKVTNREFYKALEIWLLFGKTYSASFEMV